MKFLASNVDFGSPLPNPLDSRRQWRSQKFQFGSLSSPFPSSSFPNLSLPSFSLPLLPPPFLLSPVLSSSYPLLGPGRLAIPRLQHQMTFGKTFPTIPATDWLFVKLASLHIVKSNSFITLYELGSYVWQKSYAFSLGLTRHDMKGTRKTARCSPTPKTYKK